ncbi:MAG: amidohydrolase family protein [Chloroflexi bacterium]|nr:amidohydrolase family protein [Chloroflexota bacterium]
MTVFCAAAPLYDGSGGPPVVRDLALQGDRIAEIGAPGTLSGQQQLDVSGLAVAPGFINMMCWAVESLIEDGRSQSDIRQGVTLEVMGEGFSMGPLSDAMRARGVRGLLGSDDIEYEVVWTTLAEYLDHLVARGVSPNVASFVGTSTLRIHEVGYDDRPPTAQELDAMCQLVRQAMADGALGLSSALIYPPASYAQTDELIALARAAAEYDGIYISHLRSEGQRFYEALDEFLTIVRETGIRAEIYHLKAAGRRNWDKMDDVIRRVEAAQAQGLAITADMYTYTASGTGLEACLPPWVHDGGHDALLARLRDPATRERIVQDMNTPDTAWENMWLEVQGAENIILGGFKEERNKTHTGKTLAQVAAERGQEPIQTLFDLLVDDGGRIFAMYFSMSEENVRKQIALPWVSFCSDAESLAPEGVFLKSNPHPRAYGSFARLLGRYVRDEQIIPLEEAVRRLAALPASVLKIKKRGVLRPGYFCRRGGLRPGPGRGQGDLCAAAPVRRRHAACLRQRHAGAGGR